MPRMSMGKRSHGTERDFDAERSRLSEEYVAELETYRAMEEAIDADESVSEEERLKASDRLCVLVDACDRDYAASMEAIDVAESQTSGVQVENEAWYEA